MSKVINVGTLFSGIGAPEEALKQRGIPHHVSFACDNDSQVKKTYLANHTCDFFYDNIETMPDKLPSVDLLIFGFPCQAFSFAGRKKGIDDPRGKLVFKAVKILRNIKPSYFIAENVVGLKHDNGGKTFKDLLLQFRRSGYHVYHQVLNSLDFGVPQKRMRVWIVGIRKDINGKFIFPMEKRTTVPLSNILDKKVNKRFYATDKLLKKDKVKKRLKNYNKDYVPCLTHTIARNGSSSEYISYVVAVNRAIGQKRKPTPRECARLQGFSDTFILPGGVSITSLYKQFGNAMTVPVIESIFKNLFEDKKNG